MEGIQLLRFNHHEERNQEIDNNINNFSTQLEQTNENFGVLLGSRLAVETDDTGRLNRAITAAGASGGSGVVRLVPNKEYNISTQLNLPLDKTVSFECDGLATIKAMRAMSSMLFKGVGAVDFPKFKGLILDGNGLADHCLTIEQANTPIFENVHFKNAKVAVIVMGKVGATGALCYEARFSKVKITGVDSSKFSADLRPEYGIRLLAGATDNHITDIVIRNVKYAGIRDEGANNVHFNTHVFGFPEEGYKPDYAIDVVNGHAIILGLYSDGVGKCGVKLRSSNNIITNCIFFWRYDTTWDKSQVAAVEVDANLSNNVIIGNSIRGNIGYDIRYLGAHQSIYHSNSVIGPINQSRKYLGNNAVLNNKTTIQQTNDDTDMLFEVFSKDSGKYATIKLGSGSLGRWKIQKGITDENFIIKSCNDDGTDKATAFSINRNNGNVNLIGGLELSTAGTGMVLKSADGTKRARLTLDNDGTLKTTLF